MSFHIFQKFVLPLVFSLTILYLNFSTLSIHLHKTSNLSWKLHLIETAKIPENWEICFGLNNTSSQSSPSNCRKGWLVSRWWTCSIFLLVGVKSKGVRFINSPFSHLDLTSVSSPQFSYYLSLIQIWLRPLLKKLTCSSASSSGPAMQRPTYAVSVG